MKVKLRSWLETNTFNVASSLFKPSICFKRFGIVSSFKVLMSVVLPVIDDVNSVIWSWRVFCKSLICLSIAAFCSSVMPGRFATFSCNLLRASVCSCKSAAIALRAVSSSVKPFPKFAKVSFTEAKSAFNFLMSPLFVSIAAFTSFKVFSALPIRDSRLDTLDARSVTVFASALFAIAVCNWPSAASNWDLRSVISFSRSVLIVFKVDNASTWLCKLLMSSS